MLQSVVESGTFDAILLVTALILLMAYELISGLTLQGMSRLRNALRVLLIPVLLMLLMIFGIRIVHLL